MIFPNKPEASLFGIVLCLQVNLEPTQAEHLSSASSRVRYWPYQQTFDKAGYTCHG